MTGDTVIRRSLFGAVRGALGPDGGTTILDDAHARLIQTSFIATTSQVMVPAAVLAEVGPSDERFPISSDYDLYLRIAARHPVALVARPLVRWRYLATSVSGPEDERELRWGVDMLEVLRKHARLSEPSDRCRFHRWIRHSLGALVLEACVRGHQGHRRWATRYLLGLARRHPAHALVPLTFLAGLWSPRAVTSRLGPRLRSRLRAPTP